MAHTQLDTGVEDGWPWNCARCGATIYRDAVHCESCERHEQGIRNPGRYPSAAFSFIDAWIEWIEGQSYPSLVVKSSTIAGIELLLTSLWLRILYLGLPALPTGVPI